MTKYCRATCTVISHIVSTGLSYNCKLLTSIFNKLVVKIAHYKTVFKYVFLIRINLNKKGIY